MKLDIGGVALGALIGLGAILIIPKLAQIFSGAHGGYGRSKHSKVTDPIKSKSKRVVCELVNNGILGLEDEMASVTNILSRIDNSLAANNIDSTSCSQRVMCNIVNAAAKNKKTGESTSVDDFVISFTKWARTLKHKISGCSENV